MTTSKVLYSNSNEISELIESVSGWKVTALEGIPEEPGELYVFDLLFYHSPKEEWTVPELLEKRPSWEQQILPLLKKQQYAYLFTRDWCLMSYIKELDRIMFQPNPEPLRLDFRQCLLSTSPLGFMMRQEIKHLIAPAIRARITSNKLSFTLKRPVDFGTPLTYHGLVDEMEELYLELDAEIERWKDRFFFEALETDEDTLCSHCKETMRKAFYMSNDRKEALKWRPHGDGCDQSYCKYYKWDILDYEAVLSDPIEGE